MRPSLALSIGAVLAALFGALLIVVPGPLLSGFGLHGSPDAIVVSRDVGATLVGLGVLNWIARRASGVALRGILIGNAVVQALETLVNGYEVATGALPPFAAGGVVLHVALGAIYLSALGRPEARTRT